MFLWIGKMQFWWSFRILFCQKPENQQLKVRNWCKKNSSFEENLVLSKISSFTRRRQLFIPVKKFSLKVRKIFAHKPRKKKLIYTSEFKFLQKNFSTRRIAFWQSSLKCSTVNPIISAWSPWKTKKHNFSWKLLIEIHHLDTKNSVLKGLLKTFGQNSKTLSPKSENDFKYFFLQCLFPQRIFVDT